MFRPSASDSASELLTGGHEAEALAFLAERPIHTVILAGFIRDNGLESSLNRGRFYAFRDEAKRLQGIALLGEITTFEARTEDALAAFARRAQDLPSISIIIGEHERVGSFWRRYAGDEQAPPRIFRELLFELRRHRVEAGEELPELRTATPGDLEMVLAAHAEIAFNENGINPVKIDPQGFSRRCARRIGQQRVWVLTGGSRLIFKADIIAETPDVVYLEGIYVNPEARGRGYGFRCLSQLGKTLLARTKSICLLVNEQNTKAQNLYRKIGYEFRDRYDTIFMP